MSTNGVELDGVCAPPAPWNNCAYPVESQDSMSVPTMAFGTGGDAQLVGDAARAEGEDRESPGGKGDEPK